MSEKKNNQLPVPRPDLNPSLEVIMDLETAKGVLNDVVATNTETITNESPLDQFASHPVGQIRQALHVVLHHLISTHPAGLIPRSIEKKVPRIDGLLVLGLARPVSIVVKGFTNEPPAEEHLRLTLYDSKRLKPSIMDFELALTAYSVTVADALSIGYREREKRISLMHLGFPRESNLDDYRFMMRGLRWTAANLARWDEVDIIMPEELASS